ncbi:MAG: hypothetical protein K9J12_09315 [Melioribacteraceae bacterium]|nr:hypothetical protein [Melioribacteraceae bacterium]MCF8264989.1 hypothetical protein [Melioribacteraceae bacterium]MCF8431470.1 hypothetical protein [Melioribacteraceae bacterium]
MKNTFPHIGLIVFAFTFLISLSSCDDTLTGSEIDNRYIPPTDVKYSEHIQPIFDFKCNSSGCHDGSSSETSVILTSWALTTANPLIVFPGSPDNSILVWAIEGQNGAEVMPPYTYPVTPINESQRNGIKTWIAEGAKNN